MARRKSTGGGRPRSRVLVAAALVLLTAAAAGSVLAAVLILGAERAQQASAFPTSIATATIAPTDGAFVSPPARILSAVSDQVAWRSSTTTCLSGRAVIEGTTDGGASWTGYDLGTAGGLSGILAVGTSTASEVPLVAVTTAGCSPTFVSSMNSGAEWIAYPGRIGEAWYVPSAKSSIVMARGSSRPTPCATVAQVTDTTTSNGAVLCSDQRVFRTTDAGATWDSGVLVPGAVAINAGDSGYVVATTQRPGCGGVSVALLGATLGPSDGASRGCADVPYASDQVAIAQSHARLWLWAGGIVLQSADEGNTWSK